MKKNIIIIFITAFTVTALTLFAAQIKNKPLKLNKQAEYVVISEVKQAKLNVNTPQEIKITSEEINKIEQYAKEFNMPAELKEELVEAVIKGTIDTQWGKDEISKKEIDDAGLSLNKLGKQKSDSETANISAGYIVNSAKFEKMLAACKPAKDDNEQIKELKKQALEELGFSALAGDNKEQIEEIISQTKSDYPDIPEMSVSDISGIPMLELEKSLLALKDGYSKEAWEDVTKVLEKNQDDKEFVEIAQALLEEIKKYE